MQIILSSGTNNIITERSNTNVRSKLAECCKLLIRVLLLLRVVSISVFSTG